jgi:hypothetical protein
LLFLEGEQLSLVPLELELMGLLQTVELLDDQKTRMFQKASVVELEQVEQRLMPVEQRPEHAQTTLLEQEQKLAD